MPWHLLHPINHHAWTHCILSPKKHTAIFRPSYTTSFHSVFTPFPTRTHAHTHTHTRAVCFYLDLFHIKINPLCSHTSQLCELHTEPVGLEMLLTSLLCECFHYQFVYKLQDTHSVQVLEQINTFLQKGNSKWHPRHQYPNPPPPPPPVALKRDLYMSNQTAELYAPSLTVAWRRHQWPARCSRPQTPPASAPSPPWAHPHDRASASVHTHTHTHIYRTSGLFSGGKVLSRCVATASTTYAA